jgi:hypothetical protein
VGHALELGERQQHIEGQPSHRSRRVLNRRSAISELPRR